jgi:hypothetical protein
LEVIGVEFQWKAGGVTIAQYYLSCYNFIMKATQTVVVPANHRLTIDVPPEVPAGPVILTFTPAGTERKKERVFGCAKGQFHMAEDFDAPLDDFKEYM